MLADTEIRQALASGHLTLEPFADEQLQPASYDLRVGSTAFVSSSREAIDVANKGLVVIEPGEFAILETRERIACSSQVAAQLGLRSEYARKGLMLLSGPQVDPGFDGILVVRVVNLAPHNVALAYEAPFLTAQFFMLATPVAHPYSGARQGQTGITPVDISELSRTEGMTLGQVIKTLSGLAHDVGELKGSVGRLSWSLPAIVAFGIAVIAVIIAIS